MSWILTTYRYVRVVVYTFPTQADSTDHNKIKLHELIPWIHTRTQLEVLYSYVTDKCFLNDSTRNGNVHPSKIILCYPHIFMLYVCNGIYRKGTKHEGTFIA